jgi:phosphate-selective porin OprO/OprP
MRITESGSRRWISTAIIGWTLAGWHAGAMGQEGSPPIPAVAPIPSSVASPSDPQQELLDRLRKMEQRLDQVTKQNEDLSREVRELKALNQDQS